MDLSRLAERTLKRTWDLHQALFTFIDDAIEDVRESFDPECYDPWYFTHSVRYRICRSIDEVSEDLRGFKRIQFPMSGIEVEFKEFRVKVWKVNGGEMPIAGQSSGREEFLEQRQPFLDNYVDSFDESQIIPLKLFISWDINASLRLKDVQLVCPRTFDSPWKPGEEYFKIVVPHPALHVKAPREFTEEPGELDIPLEYIKKTSDGNDNS